MVIEEGQAFERVVLVIKTDRDAFLPSPTLQASGTGIIESSGLMIWLKVAYTVRLRCMWSRV